MKKAMLLVGVGLLSVNVEAIPVDLINNGGFETGDARGWISNPHASQSHSCRRNWNVAASSSVGTGDCISIANPSVANPLEGNYAVYNSINGSEHFVDYFDQRFLAPTEATTAELKFSTAAVWSLERDSQPYGLEVVFGYGFQQGLGWNIQQVFAQSYSGRGSQPWTEFSLDLTDELLSNLGTNVFLSFRGLTQMWVLPASA
ncbi:MAG: hypothetical protein ACREYC_17100 [Gammaproteobacteria bacterium]